MTEKTRQNMIVDNATVEKGIVIKFFVCCVKLMTGLYFIPNF